MTPLATRPLVLFLMLLSGQQPIRVDVSVVTVGVRVTDSRGRDVRGLKVEAFSLFEDGIAQEIAHFSNETQPIALGILLDSSSSMAPNQKIDRAKDAARALVGGVREGSELFYIDFDNHVRLAASFTSDRRLVESVIDQTAADGGTSLYDAVLEGLKQTGQARLPRQALVIISDGADQHSTHDLQETVDIVRESQLQIYTIGYFSREEETLFRASGSKISLTNGDEVDNPRLALERIAKESGARSFFPRSDEELAKAVNEINEDLRTQYTVAFYPKSSARDGYHQLRVTVQGGRYDVRARPGYGARTFEPGTSRPNVSGAFERNVERREGRSIYSDNFQNPESGWPQRATAQYSGQGYRLAGENIVVTNGPVFRDFHAVVSLSIDDPLPSPDTLPRVGAQLPGRTVSASRVGAGLLFRQTDQGYYGLLVFPPRGLQSGYAAAIRTEGLKSTELDRWPLMRRPSPDHKIGVRCRGSGCDLYEGGALFGRLRNVAPSEGRIGLLLAEKGEALFNGLTVEEIQ